MGVKEYLIGWITDQVEGAGAEGTVFGLSGGLDSSVCGALCVEAMGERALGLLMPCHSDPQDLEHAELVAEKCGIPVELIDLGSAYDALLEVFAEGTLKARANIKSRLRMIALYYYANLRNYLVVGTSNRSELMVGYFTKHGDGGVDVMPLAGIYKTDLVSLARELGIPEQIIEKEPSGGLWEGQTDEAEMGISYRELDSVLESIEAGKKPAADPRTVEKVRGMIGASSHKRKPPPVCDISENGGGVIPGNGY